MHLIDLKHSFVEMFLLQDTSDESTYISVGGGVAFYETRIFL
jgi:hypothetical protein